MLGLWGLVESSCDALLGLGLDVGELAAAKLSMLVCQEISRASAVASWTVFTIVLCLGGWEFGSMFVVCCAIGFHSIEFY